MEIKSFSYSNSDLITSAFDIRNQVFVIEQEVDRAEEFDEYEKTCLHYLAFKDGIPVGTSRWRFTENGIKFERFAVLNEFRNSGAGRALIERMLMDVPPSAHIYMHAQVKVLDFYRRFGFESYGALFSECNIDHYAMSRNSSDSQGISLQKSIDHVREFHNAFGLHVAHEPIAHVDDRLLDLRFELMREENEEYLKAAKEGDLIEIADALGDMLYILNGTILTHGMQDKIGPVFEEIQRSNMSKLDENGNAIYREDGKVMKSNLYFKPNIEGILNT